MSLRLQVTTVGDPVLRQVGRDLTVDEIRSSDIQRLIELMRETIRNAGVGLAAPQVGQSLQLAVIEDRAEYHKGISEEDLARRGRAPVPFHVVINPRIRLLPGPEAVFFEGCLSLPGFSALVPRATRVEVDCLDQNGEPIHIKAEGWHARILQHEIDHINGTLYTDRMLGQSFTTMENYARFWKDKPAEDIEALASCRP
ncbi:peptide deformylase [Phyllobacterium leguminum]|uniref:Peptide deformylase n=1 Tax=Phyllobacterium leguminum TaxID=314237 RepID=A0A318SXH9_9HYPH|nr:peptide deformylase [Phyllobacterium leguminum]PYE86652.1 peptide deformylase [Phyllobacterium leguminum]